MTFFSPPQPTISISLALCINIIVNLPPDLNAVEYFLNICKIYFYDTPGTLLIQG